MKETKDCGEYDTDDCADDINHEDIEIEERIVHENYDEGLFHNDIALIRLKTKAKVSRFVKPICLPWTMPSVLDNLTYHAAG